MKKISFKPTSESQHRKCRCDLFNGFIKMKSGRQSNRGACGGIVASHDRWSVELFVDLPVSIENKDRTRTTDVERSVS
ncbi:MAG: hypothetical protein DME63_06600 [Verrucomicrobia bacterium]|nr:MAG: hypothetical protein DME63_06600 [Verrucomicrobiota bacterium]